MNTTELKPEKNTSKKPRGVVAGKFNKAPIEINNKTVTVELPRNVAEYFGLVKPEGEEQPTEICWATVNGIIQLSPSSNPYIGLPMLTMEANKFVPRKS